ncbi:hypothetical protein HN588_09190 [Candidatus Bathyarchaeota archaeon]|nr:hypothetical protein [Candidatus Bathyarchaeota archaeon]
MGGVEEDRRVELWEEPIHHYLSIWSIHPDHLTAFIPIPTAGTSAYVIAMRFESNGDLAERFLRWFPVFDQIGVLLTASAS